MKRIGILSVVVLLFGCQFRMNQPQAGSRYAQLFRLSWLIGSWQKQSAKGVLIESWRQQNDSTFVGQSFFVSGGGDTLSTESIRLEQRNGRLYYIPTVSGQNDGKAVVFAQTGLTGSTATFENPAHDFPQKIEYRFQKPDSLVAEISAMVNNELKSRQFRMKKID